MEHSTNQQTLHLDAERPDDAAIELAANALRAGQLVVVPTETVYGVAADPDVDGAQDKLFQTKSRDRTKPIAILVADVEQIDMARADWPKPLEKLADAFWPGPLTIVMGAETESKGYRMPDHPVALALLKKIGHGLAVTSANRSGEAPAQSARDAVHDLGDEVTIVLDAGASPGGTPSTVVRCKHDGVELLRAGAIPVEEIERVLSS